MKSTSNQPQPLSVGQLATLACTLEVTIPKPGNVHRSADFDDTTLQDFLTSAIAIGPAMDAASDHSLGRTVLTAVRATRQVVHANTNLGIVLLFGPIASVTVDQLSAKGLSDWLAQTTASDSRDIFSAIAEAKPGGLGTTSDHDVNRNDAPSNIVQAMELAQEKDLVARQYANGFQEVIQFVLPAIQESVAQGHSFCDSVIDAHLRTMHKFPDSLIARKKGNEVAAQSAAMAGQVIATAPPGDSRWLDALQHLDFWLRSDGNSRNPGTTADLIAAALFVGLRRGTIKVPVQV